MIPKQKAFSCVWRGMNPLRSLTQLVLITLCSLASLTLTVQAAESTKAPPVILGSKVIDWEKLAPRTTKTGERRELFDAPTATLSNLEGHVTTLNPGETPHAPHRHPDEEMIIVKVGTLEVFINGETQRAGPGSVFFYASNDLHGLKNVGTTPATYFVFRFLTPATPKAPAPAAK
jgi:XRE family transcriptional regulator, regulator of sulfur utilization